jgi:hypothetical protein
MTSPAMPPNPFGPGGIAFPEIVFPDFLYQRCRTAAEIMTTPPTITATSRIAV